MERNGVGKIIFFNGSFQEGTWEMNKLTGANCRMYDSESGNMYLGAVDEGKKTR